MKKTKSIISAFLTVVLILSLFERTKAKVNYQGYETWTMKDASFFTNIKNGDKAKAKGGKNTLSTTGVQGMNVGEKYLYHAKIHHGEETAVSIFRTDIAKKDTIEMDCSGCYNAGHANDILVIIDKDNVKHLLITTAKKENPIASFKVKGNKLTFTGFIKLLYNKKPLYVSGVRLFERDSRKGIYYLLFKYKETFYHGQIKEAELSGKKTINIYQLAILDKKNAVFVNGKDFEKENKKYYRNLETWVGQGFAYNPKTKIVYTPYFSPTDGDVNLNSLLLYDVSKVFISRIIKREKDNSPVPVIFPLRTSYLLKASDRNYEGLEIEACGFRTGQGTKGDQKMYCNANIFSKNKPNIVEKISYHFTDKEHGGDAIFTFKNITSLNRTSVFDKSKKYFTVEYDGNGGKNVGKNGSTGPGKGYFDMSFPTRHVYGITSNLRPNYFEKKGKKFKGWSLYRKHDKRTLYRVNKSKVIWCTEKERKSKGSCKKAELAYYEDRQGVSMLSPYHKDTVIAKAMWI